MASLIQIASDVLRFKKIAEDLVAKYTEIDDRQTKQIMEAEMRLRSLEQRVTLIEKEHLGTPSAAEPKKAKKAKK